MINLGQKNVAIIQVLIMDQSSQFLVVVVVVVVVVDIEFKFSLTSLKRRVSDLRSVDAKEQDAAST